MMKWTLSIALCIFLLATGSLSAQQSPPPGSTRKITGVVTSNTGEVLSGATITVKDHPRIHAISDGAGKYSIMIPPGVVILQVSHVGHQPAEVKAGPGEVLNIEMAMQAGSLDDVILIGYGSTKRKDVTGAIGRVNIADLQKAPVKSFDDALGGRVAGVQVTSFDGQPGSSNAIVIRGNNSLTQDNSPLYVVDGFPIEDMDNNNINPADIESIDVLKDASATAIYGARGANGVIIITTKRGKLGAPVVNYTGYIGMQKDVHRIPVLSPYEFVKLQTELDGNIAAEYLSKIGRTLDYYKGMKGIDWYDMVFRRAIQQSHTFSISGGSTNTKYSLSGSIIDQDGIVINSGFKRYQGRFTLDQTVSDKFRVGVTTNFSHNKDNGLIANNNGGSSTFMWTVWGSRPVQVDPALNIQELLIDPEVQLQAPTRTNPFLQVQNQLRDYMSNTLFANGYAEYALLRDLKLRVTGGVSIAQGQRNSFDNSKTRAGSTLPGSVLGVNGSESFSNNTSLTNENTLTYRHLFGPHSLTAVAGYTIQTGRTSSFGALASNVPNESLGVSGLDEGIPYSISSSSSTWGLLSYLGRINYSYKSKYTLTVSMRADGSSKFPLNNRWGYFPSGAFAYRLSDEPFMKNLPFITDAKVRIGYGATGNNRVGDFSYLSSMNFVNNNYSFGDATPSVGAIANALGNGDLKWETTRQTNLGIDLSLFNNRVSLTADVYSKTTSDLLLNASMPITTGYTTAFKNIGKVSNKGLELTLNTVNITGRRFSWSSSFNISFNRNKVVALTQNQEALTTTLNSVTTPYYIAKVGQPIAMFYGVVFDGLYQFDDFNMTSDGTYVLKDDKPSSSTASNRNSIKPGYMKFRDLNHDGIINNYDFTIIGDPNPDFTGGFSNNFGYMGFDLNIFFQFSYGGQVYNGNRVNMEEGRFPYTNQFATYANRWTPTHTNTNIPRVLGSVTNYNTSRVIEDGSFLRFKTVSLGYQVPSSLLQRVKVKSLRIYVTAQNLFTLTSYSGVDPEVSVRNSALTPAYDYSPYPRARTYVAGVSVNF